MIDGNRARTHYPPPFARCERLPHWACRFSNGQQSETTFGVEHSGGGFVTDLDN